MNQDMAARTVLRYVVPFTYEGSFEDNAKLVDQQTEVRRKTGNAFPRWSKMTAGQNPQESDLYAFIRDELLSSQSSNENLASRQMGYAWLDYRSKENRDPLTQQYNGGQPVLSFRYMEESIREGQNYLPACQCVNMTNLGLILYKNHLGFLWYELEKKGHDPVSAQQLILFQNRIREMDQRSIWLWEIGKKDLPFGIDTLKKKTLPQYREYMQPFVMGAWIARQLFFLKVHFIAERKCSLVQTIAQALLAAAETPNAQEGFLEQTLAQEDDLSSEQESECRKEEQQRRKMAVEEGVRKKLALESLPEELIVPDKALLFTYCALQCDKHIQHIQTVDNNAVQEDQKQHFTLAYHLTNGYKDSYQFSEDLIQDMKRPFGNVIWYATQEGAVYLAWPSEDNAQFFRETIIPKIKTDYFTLYLKILYQSYSLMIYSRRLHDEIPADIATFAADQKASRKIEGLSQEIDLFLTRSMSTSVSHIHHQSEFYNYLKKQLRIQEDVVSVTAGVNALSALEKENRQEAEEEQRRAAQQREQDSDNLIQAVISMFGLLTVFSALIDGYDFIEKFNEDFWKLSPAFKILEIILAAIICAGFFTAVKFAWRAIKAAWKKNRKN